MALKKLIGELHRRSLWQVLAAYLVFVWLLFETFEMLSVSVGLPDWVEPTAAVILILLLPALLATASIQRGPRAGWPRIDTHPGEPEGASAEHPAEASQPGLPEPSSTRSATARGGIDDYNQRQVEKRAEASVEELLAEFQKNRAATIAAVEAVDEALLTTPIRSAGGISGALASVIDAIAVQHIMAHVNDIAGAG